NCWANIGTNPPNESAGTDGQDTDTGVEGSNTYYVRCQDNAGNYSTVISDSINIVLDADAPTINFNPTSRNWDDSNVSVIVTASDSSGVTYTRHCWTTSSSCDPGTSSSSTFTNGSAISQTTNGDWNLCIKARDGEGNWNSSPICSGRYQIDKTDPTVNSFSVDTNTNSFTTEDTNLTVAWTVADTGGSGLDQVEVWRKTDSGSWSAVYTDTSASGSSDSGSWTDNVVCGSTYEYGIHVLDVANNLGEELTTITATVNCPVDPDFSISRSPSSRTITQGENATYTITLTSLNGFSSSVTLSTPTGCPVGANCSFSPASITPTGNSTLTISNAPVGGPDTITIRGSGGSKTHETSVQLTVNSPAPGNTAPNVEDLAQFDDAGSMAEGANTIDNTPYFTFDVSDPDVGDIVGYQIQIDDSDGFGTPIIDFAYINADVTPQSFTYQVPDTCPGSGYITCAAPLTNGNYFWRVRAQDDDGAYSGWVLFGGGGVDFKVNTTPGGNQAPVADFSACKIAGNTILFLDQSTDSDGTIAGWNWDFGDSSSNSSLQNPQHNYDTGGTSMLDAETRVAGAKTQEHENTENIKIQEQKKSIFKSIWEFIKNLPKKIISLFKTETSLAQAGWWNTGWSYRRTITFDNTASAENLNDFPVLVKLNSSRIDYSNTQNSGQDIRFIDSDDSTVLSYEIESWNESGDSFVWVKVPRVNQNSNTDFIYIYYGNTSASDGQDVSGTWNSNYGVVYHFANSNQDSTSNNNDISMQSTWGYNSSGKIGYEMHIDEETSGTNRYSNVGVNSGQDWTISFWYQGNASPPASGYDDHTVMFSNFWNGLVIGSFGNPPERYIEYTHYNDNDGHRNDNYTQFGNGAYDLYTLSQDWNGGGSGIGRFRIYKNGIFQATFDEPNYDGWGSPPNFYIGHPSYAGSSDFYTDEFRISTYIRSDDWIAAQYKSMSDNFNSFGSEESQTTTEYSVTLIATDNDGATDSITKAIDLSAMTLAGTAIENCDFSFDLTNLSSSSCDLASGEWNLSLIYDSANDYSVERCTSNCSSFANYSSISPAKSCSELGCSFDDSTVAGGNTYYYIISNPDSLNNSTASPSCSGGQQPSGTICPLSVTIPVCQPQDVATSHLCGSITIDWLDDENASYKIQKCIGKISGQACVPDKLLYEFDATGCSGGRCQYIDKEIIPINIATPADKNYYCYGIIGVDEEGLESNMSNPVCDYSYCYRAPNWQEQ
ncbi:DUF2341 domain-containing protein, partial [Candidatus Parcubacteria bacterium]|nr:DUF2341 domain-containing protein [Candidatus Parcubacteria bacterium]